MFKFLKKHLFSTKDTEQNKVAEATQVTEATETVEEVEVFEKSDISIARKNWHTSLTLGLAKTRKNIVKLFVGTKVNEQFLEEIEQALIAADVGVAASHNLLQNLRIKIKEQNADTPELVRKILQNLLLNLLSPLEKNLILNRVQPMVFMIMGVNGSGKTTSIAKICKYLEAYKQSTILAACDTFRAAAREQLLVWGDRQNVTVITQTGNDPAAVAFDAISSANARNINVVLIDTAGRLPTQLHLMEELKKIKRVAAKAMLDAPHERLLVIDANNGQNALAQVKSFHAAIGLTGLIVTKLDGTAKGGILAAIAAEHPIPVYFIGVGEQAADLQPFQAQKFINALLGDLS